MANIIEISENQFQINFEDYELEIFQRGIKQIQYTPCDTMEFIVAVGLLAFAIKLNPERF